jgi:hypothetical protein
MSSDDTHRLLFRFAAEQCHKTLHAFRLLRQSALTDEFRRSTCSRLRMQIALTAHLAANAPDPAVREWAAGSLLEHQEVLTIFEGSTECGVDA